MWEPVSAGARDTRKGISVRLLTRLVAIAAVSVLAVAAAAPAYAAPPDNDGFGGAVTIGALPFTATQDTTEATTDADDAEANAQCGAPVTDASVWYAITPAADGALLVDVSASSYSAGVLVTIGTPGSLEIVACAPGAVAFEVAAGTTYHLMMIDDQFDGGGNGGTLRVTVETAPPPPDIDVTVDPRATFNKDTGGATVTGTVTCSGESNFSFVEVDLQQRVGRGVVAGFGGTDVACDGATHPWSVEVLPALGQKFAGGKGASATIAIACGRVFCGVDFEEHTVQLSRR